MLLRRVIEHIMTQNWTAVVLDFVIVVVGVFIGIQVSNWNAARVESADAEAYLVRLHEDVTNDIGALQKRMAFWEEVIDYGEVAIRFLEHGDLGDQSEWDVFVAFYQASQIWKYEASDPTYEELKGAGNLALIQGNALRQALVEYYEDLDRRAADLYALNPEYRRIIRAKTPYEAQTYIWSQCHRGDGTEQEMLDCQPPDFDLDIAGILDVFASDPEVLETLRFWIINLSITRGQGMKELTRLEVLADTLEKARK